MPRVVSDLRAIRRAVGLTQDEGRAPSGLRRTHRALRRDGVARPDGGGAGGPGRRGRRGGQGGGEGDDMHDLVDAYSRAVAEATERAREKRGQAGRLFDDALDAIGADFQADVAAAGMALEVGMQARAAGFRGETPMSSSEIDNKLRADELNEAIARGELDGKPQPVEFDRDAEGRPVVRGVTLDTQEI